MAGAVDVPGAPRIYNENNNNFRRFNILIFELLLKYRDHLSTAGVLLLLRMYIKREPPHASQKGSHPKDGFP